MYAANGTGTLTALPTSVTTGSTGNTIVFTYTAATGGMYNGTVTVAVPTGWTLPQTSSSSTAGYITTSTGSVSVSGSTITVSGVNLSGSFGLSITYGAGSGTATAPTTAGAATWQGQEASTSGGTFTNLASSPSITIVNTILVQSGDNSANGWVVSGASSNIFSDNVAVGDTVASVTSPMGRQAKLNRTVLNGLSDGCLPDER